VATTLGIEDLQEAALAFVAASLAPDTALRYLQQAIDMELPARLIGEAALVPAVARWADMRPA
jgi:hypothetical protein